MVGFHKLIGLANEIIQAGQLSINAALREKRLSSPEANVLMFLYNNGDGVRQDDIVSGTEVSKPAISRTVASLVRKGWVTRLRNPRDKRSYIVNLTDKARREQQFIESQFDAIVDAAKQGISEDKVEEFLAIFAQVAENLRQYRQQRRLNN